MKRIIGIDLGTTQSRMAVIENGKPVVIPNSEGSLTTPSVMAFCNGEWIVGESAKRQAITNPRNTVFSFMRFIGESFERVKDDVSLMSCKVFKDEMNAPRIDIDGHIYTFQQLMAIFLSKLVKSAEKHLGDTVTGAVLVVPADFTVTQCKAMEDAGELAGIRIHRLVTVSSAAALAYCFRNRLEEKVFSVFHFGGGSLESSVCLYGEEVLEIKTSAGNSHLGGDDFDRVIVRWIVDEYKKGGNIDLSRDAVALLRLREAAEKAKIELSTCESAEINIPYIISTDGVYKHLAMTLTRQKFYSLAEDLINSCCFYCNATSSGMTNSSFEIEKVLLVGGSSHIPAVRKVVSDHFSFITKQCIDIPDETIAMGAAIQGGILNGELKDFLLLDATTHSFGIETIGNMTDTLIEANTTIPTITTTSYTTTVDNQTSAAINVMERKGFRLSSKARKIGTLTLYGIPAAPRGISEIEITLEASHRGYVRAYSRTSGITYCYEPYSGPFDEGSMDKENEEIRERASQIRQSTEEAIRNEEEMKHAYSPRPKEYAEQPQEDKRDRILGIIVKVVYSLLAIAAIIGIIKLVISLT